MLLRAGIDLPGKFRVIYNGVEEAPERENRLRPMLGLPDAAPLVGCAARLDSQKDPMTFLEIVKKAGRKEGTRLLCLDWRRPKGGGAAAKAG